MDFAAPRPVKIVAWTSLVGYAALVYHEADDFSLTLPITPVLHAEPAYAGGTAIVQGRGRLLCEAAEAPIDVQIRSIIGGSA